MSKYAKRIIFFGGIYNILIGIFHLTFWKTELLNWKEELLKMSYMNAATIQMLNMCLTFVFFFMAYIAFFNSEDLLKSKLGKSLLYGFSIFWAFRIIIGLIFVDIEGAFDIAFLILLLIGVFVYLVPALTHPYHRQSNLESTQA